MLSSWLRLRARAGRKARTRTVVEKRSRLEAEQLEDRCLLNAASFVGPFRTIDGTGNNLTNPQWGSTDEQLVRKAPAEYGDGISSLAGADRPGPRVISNAIVAHGDEEALNDRQLSNYSYVWASSSTTTLISPSLPPRAEHRSPSSCRRAIRSSPQARQSPSRAPGSTPPRVPATRVSSSTRSPLGSTPRMSMARTPRRPPACGRSRGAS